MRTSQKAEVSLHVQPVIAQEISKLPIAHTDIWAIHHECSPTVKTSGITAVALLMLGFLKLIFYHNK